MTTSADQSASDQFPVTAPDGQAAKNLKLWVDDERPSPDESWNVARSSAEANAMWSNGAYSVVSLDYSLGRGDTTEAVIDHWVATQNWPGEVRLHSGSGSGRDLLAHIIGKHFPDGGGPVISGV